MEISHPLQAALPQLSTFLVVARRRSFSGAARELGISTSAVSQSVRQLEAQLKVVLLKRTTRAVTPTEEGARLIDAASVPVKLALEALAAARSKPGEVVGMLKLSVPRSALPWVIEPVMPVFKRRYPRVTLEVVVREQVGDFVAQGYDAAIDVTEAIARDMTRVRLLPPFEFFVVGSKAYFARHGVPKKPEDLLDHDCICFRWPAGDALYPWELERGRRTWRVPVRGTIITNDAQFCVAMAKEGLGLAYIADIAIADELRAGKLVPVLESYAAHEPGLFLVYPSRAQRSAALQVFVETTKEVLAGLRA